MNKHFFIVGAQKCGTTTLYKWLSQHPQIGMSIVKEPLFIEYEYPFGYDFYKEKYFKGDKEIYGEARVHNLTIDYAPLRIKEMFGARTKIIILIREPAIRFISAYNHFHSMRPGREPQDIEEVFFRGLQEFDLDYFNSEERFCSNRDIMGGPYRGMYLETGHYYHYIMKYIDAGFDIFIYPLELISQNPDAFYKKVLNFLDVDYYDINFDIYNVKKYTYEITFLNILKRYYSKSVHRLTSFSSLQMIPELWGYNEDYSI